MSMRLVIHPESVLLNVVAEGKFSLKEGKRTFLQILEAIALHQSKKVLFDGRRLNGSPAILERFYYGKFAAEAVVSSLRGGIFGPPQFAYVLRPPLLDKGRFGETVALNRGMHVRTFEDIEAALLWLGIEPSNKPERGNDKGRP